MSGNAYTTTEIQYIKEHIGKTKLETIAKNLDRPFLSVSVKATKLGLGKTSTLSNGITMGELAKIIQVDRKTIQGWVERHNLPCTQRITRRSKKFYFINTDMFWHWAENNKEKVDFSKIERNILAPEPSWVDKERSKNKRYDKGKIRYRVWTTEERMRLVDLKKTGLNYVQIANILSRTRESVEKQYKRIKEEKAI